MGGRDTGGVVGGMVHDANDADAADADGAADDDADDGGDDV